MDISSWPMIQLKDVCELVLYGYTSSSSPDASGPKYLRVTDIRPPLIDWASVPRCEISDSDHEKYRLDVGDIVIARSGSVGFAKQIGASTPESVFASYLVRVRVNHEKADAGFIGQILTSPTYRRWVEANATGVAQPNANARVLTSYPMRLPSLAEQQLITSILGPYTSLAENLGLRITLLHQARELLLPQLLSGSIELGRMSSRG